MKTQIFVSAALAVLLLGTTVLQAEVGDYGFDSEGGLNHPSARIKHTDSFGDTYYSFKEKNAKACVDKETHVQHQKLKDTPAEVLQALNKTVEAVKALHKDDANLAKTNLIAATDLFDTALKSNPKLKRVPISVDVEVNELDLSPNEIKTLLKMADNALTQKRTQDARDLLIPLRDEMTTTTQYLPMELYPKATKAALDALKKGENTKALQKLQEGLSTIVTDEIIEPIPLLEAQENISEALHLDKTKKKEAMQQIESAKMELNKAVLLGYMDEDSMEYKHLKVQIEKIQKGVEGETRMEKFYDELKDSFSSLMKKAQSESHKLLSSIKIS